MRCNNAHNYSFTSPNFSFAKTRFGLGPIQTCNSILQRRHDAAQDLKRADLKMNSFSKEVQKHFPRSHFAEWLYHFIHFRDRHRNDSPSLYTLTKRTLMSLKKRVTTGTFSRKLESLLWSALWSPSTNSRTTSHSLRFLTSTPEPPNFHWTCASAVDLPHNIMPQAAQ